MNISSIIENRLYQCSYPHDNYESLRNEYHVNVVVNLMDSLVFYNPFDVTKIDESFTIIRYPIFDYSTPPTYSSFRKLIRHLIELCNDNKIIAVHCMGGRGRSTIVTSCLYSRLFNKSFKESIEHVGRCVGCNVPETPKQEDFIQSYISNYYVKNVE